MKKKVQVHMLPAIGESTHIRTYGNKQGLLYLPELLKIGHIIDGVTCRHLYFTSDEKIEEGDWMYWVSQNKIIRCTDNSMSDRQDMCRKIVATTDKSLNQSLLTEPEYIELRRIRNNLRDDSQNYNYLDYKKALAKIKQYDLALSEYENLLPQIPQSFIKQYVEVNGIDEVEIEYEVWTELLKHRNDDFIHSQWTKKIPLNSFIGQIEERIKVDSYNCVIVHFI